MQNRRSLGEGSTIRLENPSQVGRIEPESQGDYTGGTFVPIYFQRKLVAPTQLPQ